MNYSIKKYVLFLVWTSVFALLWLMIMGVVPGDAKWPWGYLGIFLMIGLGTVNNTQSK